MSFTDNNFPPCQQSSMKPQEINGLNDHFHRYERLLHRPALHPLKHPFLKEVDLKQVLKQVWDLKDLEEHLEKLKQLHVAQHMLQCPILGVMGQLNAGKSTVVASFLSEQGRDRVPRGVVSARGTHRFVYWVPQSWLDDEQKRELLFELLQTVHQGRPIDWLPTHPQEAEEAYRKGEYDPEAFFTPLVAGDKGLDELRFALLDCPDVESAPAGDAWKKEARQRWEFVVQASRLCSTTLLVVDFSKLRAENLLDFLQEVRQRTQPVPLYLLVNKVHTDISPQEFVSDHYLQQAASCTSGIYAAFDYNRRGWRKLVPQIIAKNEEKYWLPKYLEELWEKIKGWWRQEKVSEPFPIFFSIPTNQASLSSTWRELEDCEQLLALPNHLEPGRQQQEKLNQWRVELLEQMAEAEQITCQWQKAMADKAKQLQRKLWQFCVELFITWDEATDQHVVRSPVRPQLISAFNKALEKTAPLSFRVSLKIKKGISSLISGIRWIFQSAKEAKEKIKNYYEKVVANRICGCDPSELAKRMCNLRWVPADIPEERVAKTWQSVLEQLDRIQKTFPLDNQELEDLAREQWKRLPKLEALKILGAAAAVCVVLAAVDGGATLLTWMGVLGSSTITALPGGALLAVSLVPGTLGVLLTPLVNDASLFLSALFHLACDELGLPRVEGDECKEFVTQVGSQELYLVDPQVLNLKPPQCPPAVWLHPTAGIYRLEESLVEFFKENRKWKETMRS